MVRQGLSARNSTVFGNQLQFSVIVGALRSTTEREPIVVGKPSTLAFDCLRIYHPNVTAKTSLMIGDKPKNDMQFAKNCGMDSLMVLTGSGTLEELAAKQDKNIDQLPNYILSSIADLGNWL